MKTIFITTFKCITFLLCFAISFKGFSQGPALAILCNGGTCSGIVSPNGTQYSYVANMTNFTSCDASGGFTTCRYKWEVTNGKFPQNNNGTTFENDNLSAVMVKWDNVNEVGKLKVTSSTSATCSSCPGLNKEISVDIRSLGNPGNIKINGVARTGNFEIPCGTTPFTVSVDPSANATSYAWSVPVGSYTGSGNSITVTPTLNGGGLIKVVVTRSDVSDLSFQPQLNITRPLPTMGSISNTLVKVCNTTSTISVSASGSDADKFIWTPSANVRINGSSSEQTLSGAVNIGATGDGTFTVRAFSTSCNIATGTASQKQGTVQLASPPNLNNLTFDFNNSSVNTLNVVSAYNDHYITLYPLDVSSYSWNQSWSSGVASGAPGVNRFDFQLQPGQSLFFSPLSLTNVCGTVSKSIEFWASWSLMAYPNPATSVINVDLPNIERLDLLPDNVDLYSEKSGSIVRSISTSSLSKQKLREDKKIQIDVADLARGTYYLHLTDKERKKPTEKIRVVLK